MEFFANVFGDLKEFANTWWLLITVVLAILAAAAVGIGVTWLVFGRVWAAVAALMFLTLAISSWLDSVDIGMIIILIAVLVGVLWYLVRLVPRAHWVMAYQAVKWGTRRLMRKAWRNPWLAIGLLQLVLSIIGFVLWCITDQSIFGWLSLVTFIVAVACFLRHGCLHWNWCRKAKVLWRRSIWPKTKGIFGAVRTALRHIRVWVRVKLWPMLAAALRPLFGWLLDNVWLVLAVLSALLAYITYNGEAGWKGQSAWFWAGVVGALGFFLAWSPHSAGIIGGGLRTAGTAVWEKYQKLDQLYSAEVSGVGKAVFWVLMAIPVCGIAVYLYDLYQHPHAGRMGWWLKQVYAILFTSLCLIAGTVGLKSMFRYTFKK